MGYLLDTHVALWWLEDSSALPHRIKHTIDGDPDVLVSPVTAWEVTIKQNLGKLETEADILHLVGTSGFRELALTFDHALAAGKLPLHHRDPFDRMLVAQAQCDELTLVTHDHKIHKYDVDVLSV